jgi:hypothetical protein
LKSSSFHLQKCYRLISTAGMRFSRRTIIWIRRSSTTKTRYLDTISSQFILFLFLEYSTTSTLTMPPNRKGSTDLAQGITNLNVASFVTTTKYQPLTQPQVNAQAVQETQGKTESLPKVSYWDWPTDTDSPKEVVVERILEEERIRQLFSVNRIESNLIAASEKSASLTEDTVAVTVSPTETDNYWYTPEEEVAPVASQCIDSVSEPAAGAATEPLQNYWDFPAFKAQERQKRAAQEYWYTPEERATGTPAEQPQNYWDFPAFKSQERVAQAVMEEERIRQMLAVNHIQERLMEQYLQNAEPSPAEAANDAYWVF